MTSTEMTSEEYRNRVSRVENKSGLVPVGRAVLLLPYDPDFAGSAIVVPEGVRRSLDMLESRAIVIAVGPSAWEDEPVPRAYVGDKVLVTRYCGAMLRGPLDDVQYRMVNGDDIYAKIIEEKARG